MHRTLPALMAIFALACDDDRPWTPVAPADVTLLLPLDSPLSGTDIGRHGILVPRAHFDAITRHEPLTVIDEPDDLYDALRVVAVRLDPCFVEARVVNGCPSQVRLVLQPVFSDEGGLTTRDAALHAFYAVPRAELDALAQSIAALRDGDGAAIGLHPAPARLADLILKRIGERRLTRITHMSVHASNEAWVFAGFDIASGRRQDLFVPGGMWTEAHDFRYEQHITSTGAGADLAATLIPEPTIEPDIAGFLDETRRASLSAQQRTDALTAIDRLLDPAFHDPGTVDCVSCHVATTALRYATHHTGNEAAPANTTAVSPAYDDTRNQRMLGYYFRDIALSPRVVAETQIVVDIFNQNRSGNP